MSTLKSNTSILLQFYLDIGTFEKGLAALKKVNLRKQMSDTFKLASGGLTPVAIGVVAGLDPKLRRE